MTTTPDEVSTRELARMCCDEDIYLCTILRVRSPNVQALHDARELARKVADGEEPLAPGTSLGAALRAMYEASLEDQETWGYAACPNEAPHEGHAEIPAPSR